MKILFNSLRFRLTLLISLMIILPMLITLSLTGFQGTSILQQEATEKLSLQATALANNVNLWDKEHVRLVQNLSTQSEIVSMKAKKQKPVLEKTAGVYTNVYLLSTIGLNGLNVARSDNEKPKDYHDRPYFIEAVAGKDIARQVLIGRTTGRPSVVFSSPIRNDRGKIIGVAMLSTDLAVVTERLKAVQLGQTGAAFVIDAQGKVLAHPEAKYAAELKDFSTHPAVRALLTGQPGAFTFTDNHDVNWLSHSIALENGWGVIVQQQKREILENVRFFWRFATLVVLTVSLMVGVLTWIIATHLVRPLEKLTQAAVAGAEGNLNQTITFQRNDEIGILVKAFNQMAAQLKASFETLATNNQELQRLQTEALRLVRAYERFVPREFLNLLGKQSIVDIQLGDQVEQEMTVLFSDIRGFTSLSEKMTPHETFEFINNYLGQMEPIIFEYHGVIDKYMGDAIMAVFPAANDAVSGAITMLKTLATYNQLLQITQFPPLHIGIGLNTGRLMLGTVGGKQRMEGTVIADAVNLASRVEELTKIYQTPLLITEHTYRQLEDPMQYHIRVVDVVKVKGKLEEVTVYEVYDADSPESIVLKDDTREDLELGFVLYHSSEFADAQPFFEKVWQVNPTDQVAQIYLNRCQEILSLTMPEKSTILVVDDMPVNVEILSLILTANHFEVLVAHDGESALAMVESHLPQLILLDVMMPGIDGFETCQRLKMQARTKNIPVIFMTVLTDQQNKLKGFEAGAVDYITKPFYKEEVLARIRVHLSNHYLRQQLLERM